MKITTALANTMLTAMGTAAAGGRLRIYSGAEPATAAEAASGTLLWEDTLASPAYTSITSQVMTMDHSVLSANGQAGAGAGTAAGYIRVYASDAATPLWQGTVSVTGGAGELQLASITISSGAAIAVTSWSVTHLLA